MRLRLAIFAVTVLLGMAPSGNAQVFLSTGPVPIYGARFSYAGPLSGVPVYGANAYGAYGYYGYGAPAYGANAYGTYGYYGYGAPAYGASVYGTYGSYGYGAPAYGANAYGSYGYYGYGDRANRFGLFGRRTSLRRAAWIFGPQTNTTTTTTHRNPTTIDGSTINVTQVGKGPNLSQMITDAENWKFDLLGQPRPVDVVATVKILWNSNSPNVEERRNAAQILRSTDPKLSDFCRGLQLSFTPVDSSDNPSPPVLQFETKDGKVIKRVDLPKGIDAVKKEIEKGVGK